MMTSPRLPSLLKIWKANIGCCESPFQMRSGADTNGCGLCRPLRLKEVERGWVLGMKEVAFCPPYPPPGSSHNSRNLISVSVLYFSDELSSLLLLSTKLRINGRGLMVWNIQVLEWPWLNIHCATLKSTLPLESTSWAVRVLLIVVELHWQQCRHLLEREREGNTWEKGSVTLGRGCNPRIFDQIQFKGEFKMIYLEEDSIGKKMIEIPRRVQLQSFQFQFNLANECLGQYDSRCQEFGRPKNI